MHIAILTFQGFNELDSFIALGVLNRIKKPDWRVTLLFSALLFAGSAIAAGESSESGADKSKGTGTVAKVEKAVAKGAHAAASGVERGAKAAARGVKRGADATGRGLNRAASKITGKPSSPASSSK